jgi:anti-sigma B factor antagonist
MSDFTIGTRAGATCIVLMPAGDLDVQSAPTLRWELAKAIDSGVTTVTVDLDQLRLCDSVGISALIFGYQQAGLRGVTLSVINARGEVATVLGATGLSDVFRPAGGTPAPAADHG